MISMFSRVCLLVLFGSCLVRAQDNCQQTAQVFRERGYDETLIPESPVNGQFLQLCPEVTETCCNSHIEQLLENTTRDALANFIPPSYAREMIDLLRNSILDSYDQGDNVAASIASVLRDQAPEPLGSVDVDVLRPLEQQLLFAHDIGDSDEMVTTLINRYVAGIALNHYREELGVEDSYTDFMFDCVARTAIQRPLFDVEKHISIINFHFKALHLMRNLALHIFNYAFNAGLDLSPLRECVRAHAELFHCQVCSTQPNQPSSKPCRNVCRNVMFGCTAFYEDFRQFEVSSAGIALVLDKMAAERNLNNAINRLIEEIGKITALDELTEIDFLVKLGRCVNEENVGGSVNRKRSVRTVTRRTSRLRRRLRRQTGPIPDSLTNTLYTTAFKELEESHYRLLDGLSQRSADLMCAGLPQSNCWNQQSVGGDTSAVVPPGLPSIKENPYLRSKGDGDIEEVLQAVLDSKNDHQNTTVILQQLNIINNPNAALSLRGLGLFANLLVVMATVILCFL